MITNILQAITINSKNYVGSCLSGKAPFFKTFGKIGSCKLPDFFGIVVFEFMICLGFGVDGSFLGSCGTIGCYDLDFMIYKVHCYDFLDITLLDDELVGCFGM